MKVNVRSAKEIQNDYINSEWKKRLKAEKRFKVKPKFKLQSPPITSVISCVAKYYNLSYHILINGRHGKIVSRYRWLTFYICKRILNYSFRKITRAFGLSEGTVYKGLKAFKNICLIDPAFDLDIRAIRIQLNKKYAR